MSAHLRGEAGDEVSRVVSSSLALTGAVGVDETIEQSINLRGRCSSGIHHLFECKPTSGLEGRHPFQPDMIQWPKTAHHSSEAAISQAKEMSRGTPKGHTEDCVSIIH